MRRMGGRRRMRGWAERERTEREIGREREEEMGREREKKSVEEKRGLST